MIASIQTHVEVAGLIWITKAAEGGCQDAMATMIVVDAQRRKQFAPKTDNKVIRLEDYMPKNTP